MTKPYQKPKLSLYNALVSAYCLATSRYKDKEGNVEPQGNIITENRYGDFISLVHLCFLVQRSKTIEYEHILLREQADRELFWQILTDKEMRKVINYLIESKKIFIIRNKQVIINDFKMPSYFDSNKRIKFIKAFIREKRKNISPAYIERLRGDERRYRDEAKNSLKNLVKSGFFIKNSDGTYSLDKEFKNNVFEIFRRGESCFIGENKIRQINHPTKIQYSLSDNMKRLNITIS
jgi:hypothetical protein